jgi:hypothetical protein
MALAKLATRRHKSPGATLSTCALAALGLSFAGCNAVLGIDEPIESPQGSTTMGGAMGGNVTGTGSGGSGNTTGGSGNATGGSGNTTGGGTGSGGTSSGTGGGSNGAAPDGGGSAVEFAWAEWPMPNPGTSGLPYPQAYDFTATVGVVADKVTNLKWQQAIDGAAFGWADAQALCSGLTLAGGGWRLPTRIELLSIVDFTNPNPLNDLRAFPGTPQARFWTSSPVADEPSNAWAVDFAFGNGLVYSAPTTAAYRVRCVR